MILETIDFTDFYSDIRGVFAPHFTTKETDELMELVDILSDANFRCYKANMMVISNRKEHNDDDLIANMEWVARSVGEYRVASKATINSKISKFKFEVTPIEPEDWRTDDIVYSIGEMMDRLSIEYIKREDFRVNSRASRTIISSQTMTDRVTKHLKNKLIEIDRKGFYEYNDEQRTYDLEGIIQELII